MNFLTFDGMIGNKQQQVEMNGVDLPVPESLEGARGKLAFGVRPEHVQFSDSSAYRGVVKATEYLGTTQIVTVETPNGEIKSRIGSTHSIKTGDQVGLAFDARTITIFNADTGKALLSQANQEVLRHG
jgi:multiple sugar transport system ATP-binding protein